FIWMPPMEAPDSRPALDPEPENPPSAPDVFVLPDSVPLRAIRDFAGMPLQLKIGRPTCELRCGDEILGLLRYRHGWWGPQALGRTKQGTWSFQGYGSEVAIETDKGDRTVVRPYGARRLFFGPFTRYHDPTLSLPNGHDYFLANWGVLRPHYRWLA